MRGIKLLDEIIDSEPIIAKNDLNEVFEEIIKSENEYEITDSDMENYDVIGEAKDSGELENSKNLYQAFQDFLSRNSMEMLDFKTESTDDGIQVRMKVPCNDCANKCKKLMKKSDRFSSITIEEVDDGFWVQAIIEKTGDNFRSKEYGVYEEVYSIVRDGDTSIDELLDATEMDLIDIELKGSIRMASKGRLGEARESLNRVLHVLNNPAGKYTSESAEVIRDMAKLKNIIGKLKSQEASAKIADIYEKIKNHYDEIEDALWGNIG